MSTIPDVATSDALPDPAFTQTLGRVNRMELVDLAIRAKRLALAPRAMWLAPAGYTLFGAGLGAWIAGEALSTGGVAASLAGGGALIVGSYLVRAQRLENAGYFCADLMHFIDRWPSVSENEKNSDYAARRAVQSGASRLRESLGLWRGSREDREVRGP